MNRPETNEAAIVARHVFKSFKLPHEKYTSLKSAIINFYKRNKSYERQRVLKDISFTIKKGEFYGIVGRNGSGKSTLLKLLAGIYTSDSGKIQINGGLTPFIELGVGFNHELTGRENVYLSGALLGFTRKQMDGMYEQIVSFAELEKFMDQKLKNYSSGMQVRLAFSIAIRAKSDILLIDEVLAVGDAAFQTKCFDYFYELKKRGATVVFVSHDRGSLERFCDRGALIDKGEITETGSIRKVLKAYDKVVLSELGEDDDKKTKSVRRKRLSTPQATIGHVVTSREDGTLTRNFSYGDPIRLAFDIAFSAEVANPIFGVTVWQKNLDKPVFAINTLIQGIKETGTFRPHDKTSFAIKLPPLMNDGEYYIEPAVANESATVFFDQRPKAAVFHITGSDNPYSILSIDETIVLGRK